MEERGAARKSPLEELHRTVKETAEVKQMLKEASPPDVNIAISPCENKEDQQHQEEVTDDRQQRGQWLRAAVLGANDGLVTTASLMMGVGAVKTDAKTMVMSGLAALIAGACSMAIGEFISVQTQRDTELSDLKKKKAAQAQAQTLKVSSSEKEGLPNPIQAACASALAFTVGALVPLLSAAFIKNYETRVGVLAGASSITLLCFGALGARFSGGSVMKGCLRVFVGGWAAMLITYGFLKLFQRTEAAEDL